MRRHRLISTLLLCILAALPLRAEHIYFDEVSGFAPLGGTDRLILKATGSPAPASLLPVTPPIDNELTLTMLVQNRHGKPDDVHSFRDSSGRRRSAKRPGVSFLLVNDLTDTLRIHVSSRPLPPNDIAARESFIVTAELNDSLITVSQDTGVSVDRHPPGHDSPFHTGKPAALSLQVNPGAHMGLLRVLEGDDDPALLWSCDTCSAIRIFLSHPVVKAGFAAMPGGEAIVRRASVTTFDATDDDLFTAHDASSLRGRIITSRDPVEGYWELLDFTLDDSMLRSGGRYICAMIADSRGGYKLFYVSGAERNSDVWETGRIKARLRPTRMPGAFRATWYDADGEELDPDCAVQIDTPRVLTVQFPHFGSSLRLHKIPAPESF